MSAEIELSPTAYEQAMARMAKQKPTLPRPRRRREGVIKGDPTPRPWRIKVTPSGKQAIVFGADGLMVCICNAADGRAMCEAVNRNREGGAE